jgi:hypothetical protein
MENRLTKILKSASYKPTSSLNEDIWCTIVKRNKYIARLKLILFSIIGAISIAGLIPAIKALSSDVSASGLFDYLSLAFSSGSSVFSYWKEFSLSIVESLPLMSIMLSLTFLFILCISIKHILRQIIKNQLSISL